MKHDANWIIGKTIIGMISKQGVNGRPSLIMLQFSDGSCFEFASPNAHRTLRSLTVPAKPPGTGPADSQLSFFPLDEDAHTMAPLSAAAA